MEGILLQMTYNEEPVALNFLLLAAVANNSNESNSQKLEV
jgi:hypothetical protein